MAGTNISNPSNSWKDLLEVVRTNQEEAQSGKWFDLKKTGTSGNGKCQIINVGYYLGMKDRTKTLMFSSGNSEPETGDVIQKYKPFWAAESQIITAGKGDDSRAQELQYVGQATGVSNYNYLAFAVYNENGVKQINGTDYSLSVKREHDSIQNDDSNPTSLYSTEYPYQFVVDISLTANASGSTRTYYLVGCNADGDPLTSPIKGLSASNRYHFQNDSGYIVFKIQQNSEDVTFSVTPDTITFSSDAAATANKDYFTVTSGEPWTVEVD